MSADAAWAVGELGRDEWALAVPLAAPLVSAPSGASANVIVNPPEEKDPGREDPSSRWAENDPGRDLGPDPRRSMAEAVAALSEGAGGACAWSDNGAKG